MDMMKCNRCNGDTPFTILSMFSLEGICLDCDAREQKHPKYKEACKAEREFMKWGVGSFAGFGKPHDL